MKVFVSWSGEPAQRVAQVLKAWLPAVIQACKVWVSEEDIGKGARWGEEITTSLDSSDYGIVVVTPSNYTQPWLLFEVGALARSVDGAITKAQVSPLLVGVSASDLASSPIGLFQSTDALKKEDVLRLVESINKACGDRQLDGSTLNIVFEQWWGDFDDAIAAVVNELDDDPDEDYEAPSEPDLLDTIVVQVSEQGRALSRIERALAERGLDEVELDVPLGRETVRSRFVRMQQKQEQARDQAMRLMRGAVSITGLAQPQAVQIDLTGRDGTLIWDSLGDPELDAQRVAELRDPIYEALQMLGPERGTSVKIQVGHATTSIDC